MKLNFPVDPPSTFNRDGQVMIRDVVRKKDLVLTPEEWVRQHLLLYLMSLGFSKNHIGVEVRIKDEKNYGRCDVMVWDKSGKPYLLAECKAPYIKLDDTVSAQIARYNMKHMVPYLMISNGLTHYFFCLQGGRYVPVKELPGMKS